MREHRVSRRRFLAMMGAAGALAAPGALGYGLLAAAEGDAPSPTSPYARRETLAAWPTSREAAAPILVLTSEQADNPFGGYLAEILRAEGLNCFQVADLAQVARAPLDWYDTILLAECSPTAAGAAALERYAVSGGNLIAMRPAASLLPMLGLRGVGASLPDADLRVDPGHRAAQGIVPQPLQYHGVADRYELAGAEAVAWLCGSADAGARNPAVTLNRYGEGHAVAWAYDLARSVALTRQGNPEWADRERDRGFGIRVVDMLVGWVDPDRISVPQADEQQRLLANVLGLLSQDRRPLPRLWYLPGSAQSILVATGDAHMTPSTAIAEMLSHVEERGGRMSIYYSPPFERPVRRATSRARYLATEMPLIGDAVGRQFRSVSPRQIREWRERGHEFTLHPYVGQEGICAGYLDGALVTPSLEEGWRRRWGEFTGLGYGPPSPTTRTHCILRSGWVESARLQASYGLRMNLDCYHWGPAFCTADGRWVYGYLNGTGLPMRFVDAQGRLLTTYQQPTQLADDHLLEARFGGEVWGGQVGLSAEEALGVSEMLLSLGVRDHAAIAANCHPDLWHVASWAADEETRARAVAWFDGTLDGALALGIPIWSAYDWLLYTERRQGVTYEALAWNAGAKRLTAIVRSLDGALRGR